jgi:hypothetical protein
VSQELEFDSGAAAIMSSDGKGCHKSWLQQLEPGSSEQEKRLSCCEF